MEPVAPATSSAAPANPVTQASCAPLPLSMEPVAPATSSAAPATPVTQADASPDVMQAVEERDEYWRSRIAGELQVHRVHLEAQFQQKLLHERTLFQDELNAATQKAETLEFQHRALVDELNELRRANGELHSELEAGKLMVSQLANLLTAKASQVCQYCRRSGTLAPLPNR